MPNMPMLRTPAYRPNPALWMSRGLLGRKLTGRLGWLGDCQWLSQANGSPFWGTYVDANGNPCSAGASGCTSSYTGCGNPPAPPTTSPSNTGGQNIVNQYTAYAMNPGAGGDPNAAADALSTLYSYCALNAQNNSIFGDPLDTTTCINGQPIPSYVAAANAIKPVIVTGGGSGTQGGGSVVLGAGIPVSVSLVNASRPGQPFMVGDTFKLTITGPPNSPVVGSAMQNGLSKGSTPYGATNAAGSLVISAVIGAGDVGSWTEVWSVGGVTAATPLTFTVSAPPSNQSSGASTTANQTTNNTNTNTGSGNGSSTGGGGFDLTSIESWVQQNWIMVAVVGVGVLFLTKGR